MSKLEKIKKLPSIKDSIEVSSTGVQTVSVLYDLRSREANEVLYEIFEVMPEKDCIIIKGKHSPKS